jgi:DNA-binding NarL/FixJ family response regulator
MNERLAKSVLRVVAAIFGGDNAGRGWRIWPRRKSGKECWHALRLNWEGSKVSLSSGYIRGFDDHTAPPLPGRAEREREVLELASGGYRQRQIGARLNLTENTISAHVFRARHKLGASTLAEAVLKFLKVR